jgi:hypothetical protein
VFENAVGRTYQMSNFGAFTGTINLDQFAGGAETIQLSFRLDGVLVGNTVDLDDHINVNSLAIQAFSIPTALFGLASGLVNELRILIVRVGGGAKPDFALDDLKLSPAVPITFTAKPAPGTRYHAYALRVVMIDNYTADNVIVDVSTAATAESSTMPHLSYNKLLSVAKLTNGIVFEGSVYGTTRPSQTIRQLSDLFLAGMEQIDFIADGTNAMLVLETKFHAPIILDSKTSDNFTLTVSDDLSGFIQFSASLRGAVEI